jgi:hypothetical protein
MNQPVYLITGPSGSGKTALSEHFGAAGYTCIEADSTPGLCFFVNRVGKPVPYPTGADESWWNTHSYIWEIDRLRKLIATLQPSAEGPILLFGNAGNIDKAWELFAGVFYLDIPENIILARSKASAADHSFGQRVEEPAQLIRWAGPFKEKMIELGAVSIDATQPLKDVAEDISKRIKAKPVA